MSCSRWIAAVGALGVLVLLSGTSAASEGHKPIRVCGFNPARLHAMQMREDEQFLTQYKVGIDSPGLVAFFRGRTLSPNEQRRLETLAGQLGARSFRTRESAARELTASGPSALPFLRKAARSSDPEVVRRARQCLAVLEQRPDAGLQVAAARLLLVKGADSEGVGVLLRYLPFAESDSAEETVLACLDLHVRFSDKPAPGVAAALDDPLPLCRAAAVYLLSEKLGPRQRAAAHALLKSPEPRVRLLAAEGLVRAGERVPVPALLGLCREFEARDRLRIARCLFDLREMAAVEVLMGVIQDEAAEGRELYAAESQLRQIARGPVPMPCYFSSEPSIQRRWRDAWLTWYRDHGDKVEFPKASASGP